MGDQKLQKKYQITENNANNANKNRDLLKIKKFVVFTKRHINEKISNKIIDFGSSAENIVDLNEKLDHYITFCKHKNVKLGCLKFSSILDSSNNDLSLNSSGNDGETNGEKNQLTSVLAEITEVSTVAVHLKAKSNNV